MALVLLRRTLLDNPNTQPGQPAKLALERYWNTDTRTYFDTQGPAGTLLAFELATGTEVQRVVTSQGPTTRTKIFFYAGNGRVQTKRAAGAGAPGPIVCTLAAPTVLPSPTNTSSPGASDAYVDVLPKLGAAPYAVRLTGPAFNETKTAPNAQYPVRFYSLVEGTYTYFIEDALGCQVSGNVTVLPGNGRSTGVSLLESYIGDADTGTGNRRLWSPNALDILNEQFTGGGTDGYQYFASPGDVVDGYYLPDGVTWRTVYANGNNGVYFRDSDTTIAGGSLQLENLILFNPDSLTEPGGCIVEVITTAEPVTFTLGSVSNQHGRFDNLPAGEYTVQCQDAAGNTLAVPFALKLSYAKTYYLEYNDILAGGLCRIELWLKDYLGEPKLLIMQGNPATLRSDGLNSSLGGYGDVPPVVGSSLELSLLLELGELEDILLSGEQTCRADFYYNDKLEFRGYVQPGLYSAPLLAGLQPRSLTAVDGLAALNTVYMTGHVGQRLLSRRPVLHTLLHCLSRTGVSLPLTLAVNRRDSSMGDDEAPELAASTMRAGYWEKENPVTQRPVLDAVAQLLGGTLFQREGRWQVRSLLEAARDADARCYLPAGNAQLPTLIGVPAGRIRPLARPGTAWGWVDANQQIQVRPGWKSLTGQTDANWLPNAFPAGEVFSDRYSWLENGSALRQVSGWHPAPGETFPLVLIKGGKKGTDFTTEWLRSATPDLLEEAYLESPPLPLLAAPESIPAQLTISGKLIPVDYLAGGATPPIKGTATKATLAYEVVIDGQRPAQPGLLTFDLKAQGITADDQTLTIPLPELPASARVAVLRLFGWYAPNSGLLSTAPVFDPGAMYDIGYVAKYDFGTGDYRLFEANFLHFPSSGPAPTPTGDASDPYWVELFGGDASSGRLFISEVGVKLLPQRAEWDGEDNFRADGSRGTVRPTEVLQVFHPDVPDRAGLFDGNRFAFNRAVVLADGGLTTGWLRTLDKQPSPVFEANVLDALALRDGPAKLLTGTVGFRTPLGPPRLLDAVDAPFDVAGRRFGVGSTAWHTKDSQTEVSLIEIGPSDDAPDPLESLPNGVRIVHRMVEYAPGKFTPAVRRTRSGRVRIRRPH